MNDSHNFIIPNAKWIERLPNLPKDPHEYVGELVCKRLKDIRSMPDKPRNLLEKCQGTIVDVGPGEGVSSMALAQFAKNSNILGIEMDQMHLSAAWHFCKAYKNLELTLGTIPETPSNPLINSHKPNVPCLNLHDNFCEILFSWIGMSRKDIFEHSTGWDKIVKNSCILVYPKFWREGLQSLPNNVLDNLKELCRQLQINLKSWNSVQVLPGFHKTEKFTLAKKVNARGWILWLTGVFDSSGITLLDTLRDKHKKNPIYQLSNDFLELEVLLACRQQS
jgi:hypothetical protein